MVYYGEIDMPPLFSNEGTQRSCRLPVLHEGKDGYRIVLRSRAAARMFREGWSAACWYYSSRCCRLSAVTPERGSGGIILLHEDSFNLQLTEMLSPTYAVMDVKPQTWNWFAGTLTNLPLDREVTLGLSMSGENLDTGHADLSKWAKLHPVMTYADPAQYASYECFQYDGTHWISTDPFKTGREREAGEGEVPTQQVIPPALAARCLSADKQNLVCLAGD